ncbi:flagellar motor protein MotB [Chroococcidiopsis sp. CCALA 051]|uniref:OmpA family protein n=1 Tax=Chroococcidiopsis sp. CCALA 051 TaxID=869949 RepID=UPI000D0E0169|nr:OmpA family protein [Chroococcidiopsis sp. CCALA 051]PSM51109.1 flagellar motor protein MotB [Chroococcidiopsis sp. CCALA 051]
MTDSSRRQSTDRTSSSEAEALTELESLLDRSQDTHLTAAEVEVLAQLRQIVLEQQPQTPTARSQPPPQKNFTTEEEAIAELRDLLFGPELQAKLDKSQLRVEDVSRVLPEAIILRSLQDDQLTQAAVPTVEQAIQTSVRRDLNTLSDALFPIIGPASRKAAMAALKTFVATFNQALDHSLTPRSFRWRLEAMQTGKSFAEVVLLRTLVYRVEEVFLIHRQTGLLLHSLAVDPTATQDADLVAAMLKAIQDFVQDSFKVKQQDRLDALEFGELTIWIEQGPQAILAGIIRGHAPKELRENFQATLETIHKKFYQPLLNFRGDDTPFEASKSYLENCLQSQYQTNSDKPSPLLLLLIGGLLCTLGWWSFMSFQARQKWQAYLNTLNLQAGIVVVSADSHFGKYYISGLRDPLAADPIQLISDAEIDPKNVVSRWQPYISLEPQFVTKRAEKLLQPPKTTSLKVDRNGVLYMTGIAPRQWIAQAKKVAPNLPGVTQLQTEHLTEAELQELLKTKTELEREILLFVNDRPQLLPNQQQKLEKVVAAIQKLTKIAPIVNKDVRIEIKGHADSDGSTEHNMSLSQARAKQILSTLVSQGIRASDLTTIGVGAQEPWQQKASQNNREMNRRVSFKVFLTDAP